MFLFLLFSFLEKKQQKNMKPFKMFKGSSGGGPTLLGAPPPVFRTPQVCTSYTVWRCVDISCQSEPVHECWANFIPWPPGADKPRTDSACLPVVTCGRCGDDATSSRSSDDVRWGKVRVTSEGSHRGDGGGAAAVMGWMGWMIMGWMGWMIDGWTD